MFHPRGPTFWELAIQALSSTERGYDLLAPKFDYTPFRTPDVVLQAVGQALAPFAPFGSALDICCGTGGAVRMLRPLCQRCVVGLDFSAGMLRVARQALAAAPGSAAVELVRGNALALPFAPVFDLVVCFGALGHILPADQDQFVCQIAQVLRPGGKFVFLSRDRPPLWSFDYWWRRAFNATMHLRNWLIQPPFIMFYLTFLLTESVALLHRHGFMVEVRAVPFEQPWTAYRLVIATRPTGERFLSTHHGHALSGPRPKA